ncbi:MAG: hypothetical protein QOE61_1678, partial [Micromonosporaceae bacterium]|nr:hypothetical protein [Micromonosporaceae bacterium]
KGSRARLVGVKAMEAVKTLEVQP